MRGFSKAIITGNLTRDPEMRTTSTGSNVCSFAVAVNRSYKDANGNQKEEVSYINCSAWARQAEVINQYAKKGTGILVSGRLRQHSYDGNDGSKRSMVEIVVEDFNFIGGGSRENGDGFNSGDSFGGNAPVGAPAADSAPEEVPEDIPEGEIDLTEVPF